MSPNASRPSTAGATSVHLKMLAPTLQTRLGLWATLAPGARNCLRETRWSSKQSLASSSGMPSTSRWPASESSMFCRAWSPDAFTSLWKASAVSALHTIVAFSPPPPPPAPSKSMSTRVSSAAPAAASRASCDSRLSTSSASAATDLLSGAAAASGRPFPGANPRLRRARLSAAGAGGAGSSTRGLPTEAGPTPPSPPPSVLGALVLGARYSDSESASRRSPRYHGSPGVGVPRCPYASSLDE